MNGEKLFQLDGQVALITGASRGIGRAIAEVFARQGAICVVNYPTDELAVEAQGVVEVLKHYRPESIAAKFDVADQAAVSAGVADIVSRVGRPPSILVNNAGISRDMLFLRTDFKQFDDVMRINFNGTVFCTHAVLPHMVKSRYGRIISLVSVVGEMGNPGQAAYCSSKAAIQGFSRALAREYAGRQVTVNCIAPGFIETPMTAALSDEQKNDYLKNIPLKRFGRAEEIAWAAAFLASGEAGFITGHTLRVNGGLFIN